MLTAEDVSKHNSARSCWIVIEGYAYDVTDFLDQHPGGRAIVLKYAGLDASGEYLPVHAPGTIEKELAKDKHLGPVDLATFKTTKPTIMPISGSDHESGAIPIEMCMNLIDIERAAKRVLSERAWTYFSSAAEDLRSHHDNLHDWERVSFRPRIMRNVKCINMQRKILGFNSSLPFFIAPAAMARLGHPDDELCLARGSARYDIPYCASNGTSVSHADLVQCLDEEKAGGCLFFQLYVKKKKEDTVKHILHARKLGYKALVITVDCAVVGIREEDDRYRVKESFQKSEKYVPFWEAGAKGEDRDFVLRGSHSSTLNWDDLSWIKEAWGDSGPISIKGVQTAEDARIACDMGIHSIYLSNHGGRQLDSAPSALKTLLEIREYCPEVFDKCEVLVDGGVRRSRDILKALCLGATAVGLGRPFMYALSAYGTEGVLRTIQILHDEMETSMRLLGVTSLEQLRPHLVNTRDLQTLITRDIPDFQISKSRL